MTHPGTPPPDPPSRSPTLTAESVDAWIWERSDRHTCAVPAMSDEEKLAWLDLGKVSLQRDLSNEERTLFEALDRKARYRHNHFIAPTRTRKKRS